MCGHAYMGRSQARAVVCGVPCVCMCVCGHAYKTRSNTRAVVCWVQLCACVGTHTWVGLSLSCGVLNTAVCVCRHRYLGRSQCEMWCVCVCVYVFVRVCMCVRVSGGVWTSRAPERTPFWTLSKKLRKNSCFSQHAHVTKARPQITSLTVDHQ